MAVELSGHRSSFCEACKYNPPPVLESQHPAMSEESKEVDLQVAVEAVEETLDSNTKTANQDEVSGEDDGGDSTNTDKVASSSTEKKKKSKKAKLKKALGAGDKGNEPDGSNPASKLTTGMVEQLLEMNPSLKSEVAGMDKEKAAETLKKLDVADLLTGMVCLCSSLVSMGKA